MPNRRAAPDRPSERSFLRSTGLPVNLPNGPEMIGEVRDACDHPGELEGRGVTRRTQRGQPSTGFVAHAIADLLPGGGVDSGDLPGLVPSRIRERIASLGSPAIHQREAVAQMLNV